MPLSKPFGMFTRLDYITFHVKGGGFPFQPNAAKATPSVGSFIEQAKTGLETIRKYGFQDKEIVLPKRSQRYLAKLLCLWKDTWRK